MVPLNNAAFDNSAEGTHWSAMVIDFDKKTIEHFDSHAQHNKDVANSFAERVMHNFSVGFKFKHTPCVQQTPYGNNCALHAFINIERTIRKEDLMTHFDGTKFRFDVIDWMETGSYLKYGLHFIYFNMAISILRNFFSYLA